jgi:hypothetical protein
MCHTIIYNVVEIERGVIHVTKPISFRINSEALAQKIDERVKQARINNNRYYNYALGFYADLDIDFIKDLNSLALNTKTSPGRLVQMVMTRWMAEVDAHLSVYGSYAATAAGEIKSSMGYREDFRFHREAVLRELEAHIVQQGLALEKQGIERMPREYITKVMIKHRRGKAWENSEEKRLEDEFQAEIDAALKETE